MSKESARTEEQQDPGLQEEKRPTSAAEIRDRSQRVVTSPLTGNTYRIRDYAPVDALRLQRLPKILKEPEQPGQEPEEKTEPGELTAADKVQHRLAFSEAVVEACVLEPKFTNDPEAVDGETLHTTEIAQDIYWLAEECVKNWAEGQEGKSPGSPAEG